MRIQVKPWISTLVGIPNDRVCRAFFDANSAIHTFKRIDDEHILALVKGVNAADLYAVHEFALDARACDHCYH